LLVILFLSCFQKKLTSKQVTSQKKLTSKQVTSQNKITSQSSILTPYTNNNILFMLACLFTYYFILTFCLLSKKKINKQV